MLKVTLIGNIGADAKVQNSNGREFTSFRVAHTDKWKDDAGNIHENTLWVDCVLSEKPKVVEFLKKGTQVYVEGSATLRVYSSKQDKCMKAGIQLSVTRVELLGGKSDNVPSQLMFEDGTAVFAVQKWFNIPELANKDDMNYPIGLQSRSGDLFSVDENGWVTPVVNSEL